MKSACSERGLPRALNYMTGNLLRMVPCARRADVILAHMLSDGT